jgi:hypothetical protein
MLSPAMPARRRPTQAKPSERILSAFRSPSQTQALRPESRPSPARPSPAIRINGTGLLGCSRYRAWRFSRSVLGEIALRARTGAPAMACLCAHAMSDAFNAPFRMTARRQTRAGEPFWAVRKDDRELACELRDDGVRSGAVQVTGVELRGRYPRVISDPQAPLGGNREAPRCAPAMDGTTDCERYERRFSRPSHVSVCGRRFDRLQRQTMRGAVLSIER